MMKNTASTSYLNIFQNDLAITYIVFSHRDGGKIRPVLVISATKTVLTVYPITSKYANKPRKIKQRYFEIKEWQTAGLVKPSWIDVGNKITLNASAIKIRKIGSLSSTDVIRLHQFIISG